MNYTDKQKIPKAIWGALISSGVGLATESYIGK